MSEDRPFPNATPGHGPQGGPAVFTICSRNYLPQARALVRSVREHMPDVALSVVLADECDDPRGIEAYVGTEVIRGADLGIPTYYDMAMRYDIVEFNTAIKPFAFQHFLRRMAGPVVYLDPDIQLFRPLTEVVDAFAAGAEAVITPHICQPLDMVHNPTELKLLRTGVYNLGFCALANTMDARKFAAWWARKMPADCRVDLDAGIFVDQKYVDLLPSYVPQTKILRHPGYNVAYWNLAHRPLTKAEDGSFLAGGAPLAFMHFSGIRADRDDTVSVHQDRIQPDDLGDGRVLFDAYRAELRANREALKAAGIATDYAYGRFLTGEDIPALVRQVYARAVPPSRLSFAEAFDLSSGRFSQGTTGISHAAAHLVSPVMADLWMRKPHLQAAFDIRTETEAEAYALWFAETGAKEWNIAPAFVPEAVWALRRQRRSLKSRLAIVTLRIMEGVKRFSFIYPKPVRRAAVRLNRRILPHLVKRMTAR